MEIKNRYTGEVIKTTETLVRANLRGADLHEANLRGADLHGAELDPQTVDMFQIVPQVGSFRAFKKLQGGILCELEIPANAKRVGGLVGRKCRASAAKVIKGNGASYYNPNFVYKKGKIVKVADFDPDPSVECSRGIHFFLTSSEAEAFEY